MEAFTDYPIIELGDVPNKLAPVRKCKVLSYDGDKYCEILVSGIKTSIKSGYLYSESGRFDDVPVIDINKLNS